MPNGIRSFIALELNNSIKAELTDLQSRLKSAKPDAKWVEPASMHLTLKFLGYINISEDIKNAIDAIAAHHKEFELSLSHLGGFPTLLYPRVLWVGIDKGQSQVEKLAKGLEEKLVRLGFPKEVKQFSSHLTLCRMRSRRGGAKLVSKIKALDFKPSAKCFINKIGLFQSTLTPNGPIYTPLHSAALSL